MHRRWYRAKSITAPIMADLYSPAQSDMIHSDIGANSSKRFRSLLYVLVLPEHAIPMRYTVFNKVVYTYRKSVPGGHPSQVKHAEPSGRT